MGSFEAIKLVRGGSPLSERAANALRPSVEALLLAALAMGCAQAGWTLLTPTNASAVGAVGEEGAAPRLETVEVRSPFAPDADALGAGSHAVAALLASIELDGIRMSTDDARSGAMFTLSGGEQRAFIVGQEIADGVTLADVEDGYVLLAYSGGQRRLEMSAPETFSFARAMMGLEPAQDAPPLIETAPAAEAAAPLVASDDEATPFQHVAAPAGEAVEQPASLFTIAPEAPASAAAPVATGFSEADRAWFAATLANVEIRDGRPLGWRLTGAAPEGAEALGLHAGDLIVSVNGAGPDDLIAALTAAQSGALTLVVERDGARFNVSVDASVRT